MFRLTIDPLFRTSVNNFNRIESYYLYDESFLEKNQFKLIFDEKYDRDNMWEEYLERNRGEERILGEEEEEENRGEE